METKYAVYFEFTYEIDPPRKETIDNLFVFIRKTVIHTMVRQLMKIETIDEDTAMDKINTKYEFMTIVQKGQEENDKVLHLLPKEEYSQIELEKDWKLFSLTDVFMRPELGMVMFDNPDEVSVYSLEFPKEIDEIYQNGHLRIKRIR
ncbi:MAG: hypothetical protein AABX02_02940 [archaeon]